MRNCLPSQLFCTPYIARMQHRSSNAAKKERVIASLSAASTQKVGIILTTTAHFGAAVIDSTGRAKLCIRVGDARSILIFLWWLAPTTHCSQKFGGVRGWKTALCWRSECAEFRQMRVKRLVFSSHAALRRCDHAREAFKDSTCKGGRTYYLCLLGRVPLFTDKGT